MINFELYFYIIIIYYKLNIANQFYYKQFNNLSKNQYFKTKLATPMRHKVTHIVSKSNCRVD